MSNSAAAIDLRSDTVTKPTPAMYERMMRAPVGDDGLDGDPTALELEEAAAGMLGKEAALFVPSCTMGNLLATLSQAQRSEQVLMEAETHMYLTERGSATIAGSFFVPIDGHDGAMDLGLLEDAIEAGRWKLRTGMIALETSHNNAGGTVLSLDHMAAVATIARRHGIRIHLDGARLFNAAVHLQVPAAAIAAHCDTVAICLSKGLSAPVGAIVAGPRSTVAAMRSFRQSLGGQQRQVGVVAAAGLIGLTSMVDRLDEDHERARELSAGINRLGLPLVANAPQTNIVLVDVSRSALPVEDWVSGLAAGGVLVRPWSRNRLRCVTHRHIGRQDIADSIEAFRSLAATELPHERT